MLVYSNCAGEGMGTHVNTTGEETHPKEAGVEHAVGNVAELDVGETTSTQAPNSAEHAHGTEGDETDYGDLGPWRVI
jgi:hypothetical protein